MKKKFEEEMGLPEKPEIELEDCSIESKGTYDDILDDYKLVRSKIYQAVMRSSDILDEATKMVKGLPLPNQITAASTVVKSLAENAEKLLEIHEKIRKLEAERDKEENETTVQDEGITVTGNLKDITQYLKNRKASNGQE